MHSCKLVLDNTRLNKFSESINRALLEPLYRTTIKNERSWL